MQVTKAFLILIIVLITQSSTIRLDNSTHTISINQIQALYNTNQNLDKIATQFAQQYQKTAIIKQCKQDQNIKYVRLGNNKKADGILTCGIHARQVITGQICMNWAKRYLENLDENQQKNDGFTIDMFYNANLNRNLVINNGSCARKSESGVDLNRNFPTQFFFYKSKKSSQIYPGPSPLSQPFTQCLQSDLQQNKPLFFIDIHSGQNDAFFYQQGYNSRQNRVIFEQVNKQICNSTCRITTLAQDDQAINGHIFADLKVRLKMKYTFLIQSYENQKTDKCLQAFNPSSEKQRDQIVDKWTNAIDVIIRQIQKRQKA